MSRPNAYSPRWFSTFLGDIDTTIVANEIAFIARRLPVARCRSVLDLCCGPGRHAGALVGAGYSVIGVDRDLDVLERAQISIRTSTSVGFACGDMRSIPLRSASVDAAVCMWQSFGYFDDATNDATLSEIARVLRPRGALLLDVYHREYFERHQGERQMERRGRWITEHRSMRGNRLRVTLLYEGGGEPVESDEFEWRLYSPDELIARAASAGLICELACAGFDESVSPSADLPRMQLLLSRAR